MLQLRQPLAAQSQFQFLIWKHILIYTLPSPHHILALSEYQKCLHKLYNLINGPYQLFAIHFLCISYNTMFYASE